jgi:hypothetical protein
MGFGRNVYWQQEQPTLDQLDKILTNYIGDAGVVERVTENSWVCIFPGKPISPFSEVPGLEKRAIPYPDPERSFEVLNLDDSISVLTSLADPFTDAVADGFARFCTIHWEGRREDET